MLERRLHNIDDCKTLILSIFVFTITLSLPSWNKALVAGNPLEGQIQSGRETMYRNSSARNVEIDADFGNRFTTRPNVQRSPAKTGIAIEWRGFRFTETEYPPFAASVSDLGGKEILFVTSSRSDLYPIVNGRAQVTLTPGQYKVRVCYNILNVHAQREDEWCFDLSHTSTVTVVKGQMSVLNPPVGIASFDWEGHVNGYRGEDRCFFLLFDESGKKQLNGWGYDGGDYNRPSQYNLPPGRYLVKTSKYPTSDTLKPEWTGETSFTIVDGQITHVMVK